MNKTELLIGLVILVSITVMLSMSAVLLIGKGEPEADNIVKTANGHRYCEVVVVDGHKYVVAFTPNLSAIAICPATEDEEPDGVDGVQPD